MSPQARVRFALIAAMSVFGVPTGTVCSHSVMQSVLLRVTLTRSVNSDAYSYLRSHRVAVTWSSPEYHYTHQKTVIIDRTKAVIMTANLTSRVLRDVTGLPGGRYRTGRRLRHHRRV